MRRLQVRNEIEINRSLGWLKYLLSQQDLTKYFFSNKTCLSSNLDEVFDRINLLPQKKQGGNISHSIIEEISALTDKALEYNCISTKKQHSTF